MMPKTRTTLFAVAVAAVVPALIHVLPSMPRFGDHKLPYGDAVTASAPVARQTPGAFTGANVR